LQKQKFKYKIYVKPEMNDEIYSILILVILLILPFVLSGCDGFFMSSDPCKDDPDPNSCYMRVALEKNTSYYCSKIGSQDEKEDKSLTPLRDDCYSKVAMSSGDYSSCEKIVGGKGSNHSRDNCILSVANAKEDPVACTLLRGKLQAECFENLGSKISVSHLENLHSKLENLEKMVEGNPKDKDLREELEKLRKQQDLVYNNAPGRVKRDFFRQQREKILSSIKDKDVLRAISRDFIKHRSEKGDKSVTELLGQLENIKKTQQTIKRLDEEANKLVDQIKKGVMDYAKDEAGVVAEEGWKWAWKRSSNEMKWQMSKLERMKDGIDRTSAQYQAISAKIEQFKKVYDEVNGIYKKVKEYDSLLAQGRIKEGQAKVLKGAVFLGKGLEYATGYVPVFGSTASTITKETFEVVVKLATERAQRSKSLEDCFDDPANCDTDDITAY
jgi:hypothetical protein